MTGEHPRNADSMMSSLRCGARRRAGKPCRSLAVSGKTLCRIHGGAVESGAPLGNKNALTHGVHIGEAITENRQLQRFMRRSRKLLKEIG